MRRKVPIRPKTHHFEEACDLPCGDESTVAHTRLSERDFASNADGAVPADPDSAWTPPEPSRASREIPLRSTASFRGSIVDVTRNRQFNFESKLERDFLHIVLAHEGVEEIHEQPPEVWYRDESGRPAVHTFDALIVTKDGRRIAVDIKPRRKVEPTGIVTVQRLIREQVGSDFADVYVVRTEDHFHPDDVWDARLILRARRLSNSAADVAVAALVAGLHGWCRLADLVAAAGMGAAAFSAVVRFIGGDLLEVRDRARITLDCFVRRARA